MTRSALALARRVVKMIEADNDHRYRVLEDWVVGRFDDLVLGRVVPDYECPDFSILSRVLTIRATGTRNPIIDGASCCPDTIIIDLAPGYIPHDLGYAAIADMAQSPQWIAEGWTESSIRALWDLVLGSCLTTVAKKEHSVARRVLSMGVARGAYWIVRRFGGLWRRLRRLCNIIVLLLVCMISGCAIPQGFESFGGQPHYIIIDNNAKK